MRYIWGVVIVLILLSTPALAASGHLTDGSWTDLKYRTINFLLFAGILVWLTWRKIRDFFVGRRQKIAEDLKNLENEKAEAQRHLADVEKRIANLKAEGETILNDYRKQGENIRDAIIARAEATAVQITEQAKFTIDNEAKMAADNLRESVADMVAEACEEMLKQQLDDKEHAKLIDKYLDKVVLN